MGVLHSLVTGSFRKGRGELSLWSSILSGGMGYPSMGYPPERIGVPTGKSYAAGGTPLDVFTQEDFFVKFLIFSLVKTEVRRAMIVIFD